MILSALFSVLLLALIAKAQLCNQLPCVANAACNANNQCECNPGLAGNGRTYCEANKCICSTIADPHGFLFDSNQEVTANLPCSLFFTNYFNTSCNVQVYLDTETRGTGTNANFRVFTRQMRATINNFANGLIASLTVDASGVTVSSGSSIVTTSASDGFSVAEVSNCNTRMGYNDTYGAAYLSLPTGGPTYQQFCGDCDGTADENPGSTPESQLSYYLQFLAPTAQQDGTYSSTCGTIQSTISSCSANRDAAANICLPYIDSFGKCLLSNGGIADYATLLSSFANCLSTVCSGNAATACTTLAALDTGSASCSVTTPTSCP
ncbi:hypothetical protein BaRGS_00030480 [Batillaria attramentaria]|uniref:VWFD domain-containing protein n=1 Tax=Batillaria attramentaria TaxID=370345 RepID=A0ABD0JT75_9CAEN